MRFSVDGKSVQFGCRLEDGSAVVWDVESVKMG